MVIVGVPGWHYHRPVHRRAICWTVRDQVSTWAGWILPYPNPIVLVLEEQEHLESAVTQLLRIGYAPSQQKAESGPTPKPSVPAHILRNQHLADLLRLLRNTSLVR